MKSSKTFWILVGALALALASSHYLLKASDSAKGQRSDKAANLSALDLAQRNGTVDASTSASAGTESRPQAAHEPVSDESFKALNLKTLEQRALKDLPTKAALRKLSAEEVHHTPALLMKAASELGDVAEALEARLKEAKGDSAMTAQVLQEGISFYRQCLNAEQSPESVRALCYSHYRELREKSGKPETQDEAKKIPASVRSLAGFLTEG